MLAFQVFPNAVYYGQAVDPKEGRRERQEGTVHREHTRLNNLMDTNTLPSSKSFSLLFFLFSKRDNGNHLFLVGH